MLNLLFYQGKRCSYKFIEGAGRADSNFNGLSCFVVMPMLLDVILISNFFLPFKSTKFYILPPKVVACRLYNG